ncbi:MAG: helix-turn-helix transcriptional regulator [Clostridia bacterium]|nr:helix-turn-helix transcriptional regulator [Clostridia bacterium]
MENPVNVQIIKNYMKKNHLTKTHFCKLCKISITTLNRILGGQNCKLTAIFKIARRIGVPIHQLFAK